MLDHAIEVLLDPALDRIVDMVLVRTDGAYEARAGDGRVRFTRHDDASGWRFAAVDVTGRNPLGEQAVDRFSPLAAELAAPFPTRVQNSYPFAYEQVAQLFDHPAAPDVCVLHSAAHNWEDQGGHLGEHGSIGVVQARAPFILAGCGVKSLGMVARAARLVDVAPTIAALMGCPQTGGTGLNGGPRADAFLRRQDGDPLLDLLDVDAGTPRHVVGFLLDGANANVLYDLAGRGEAPNVARLMAMGTTFAHGAFAALPTVTLANHTAVLTGAYPGHHGILNNAWFDRTTGRQVITNSPETWHDATRWLAPGVDTLHTVVRRARPDAVTVSVNEPCDLGATYSTFALVRAGDRPDRPPRAEELPHATERFVRPHKDYQWGSRVDHTAVEQAVGIWSGHHRGVEWPVPAFTWVNFTLTDSAFHAGGPHSEMAAAAVRDTDARLGQVLDAVERAGVFDTTAFFLVADHGMEENDPSATGDWDVALRDAGIPFRDEAYSFIYLG